MILRALALIGAATVLLIGTLVGVTTAVLLGAPSQPLDELAEPWGDA